MTKIALVSEQAPAFISSGLTGSTAASRYVGATASGAPTTGAHLVGDFVIAQDAHIWVCTAAGTPGTWTDTAGAAGAVTSVAGRTGAVVLAATDIATNGILPDTVNPLAVQCGSLVSSFPSAPHNDALRISTSSTASTTNHYAVPGLLSWYGSYWTGSAAAPTSASIGMLPTDAIGSTRMYVTTTVCEFTGATVADSTASATANISTGLTGATAASRYVGATASGAPGSGTFVTGDFIVDQTGTIWVCTAGGSPGTWAKVGAYLLGATNTWTAANTFSGGIAANSAITGSGTINLTGTGAGGVAGTFTATALIASGLTGATSASRYVGATASAAPVSGTFVTGDYVIDRTGVVWVCTAGGTPGTWSGGSAGAVTVTTGGLIIVSGTNVQTAISQLDAAASTARRATPTYGLSTMPTGAAVETVSRKTINSVGIANSSGQLRLVLVHLTIGQVITSLSWLSGTTGLATGTHSWATLLDSTGKVLAVSADDTAPTWAASSAKTANLTAPYTILATGGFYLGFSATATTMPTSAGFAGTATSLTPLAAATVASQTTPPVVGTTLTLVSNGNVPYGYAS